MDLGERASYLSLVSGTPVYSSDGEAIGHVTHVLAAEHRFADADEIQDIFDQGVVLKCDLAAAEQLPKPSANPAVVHDDPAVSNSDFRHQKLSRAWNLISGKY
jgi:hypothetical protein